MSKIPTKEHAPYREAYGFSEEPFALTPDPKFLYLSCTHMETLSSMLSGIKNRKGIVVVTGEAGLGKTLLIYTLLRDLDEKGKTAFIFNPRVDFRNILENILRDLGEPVKEEGEILFSLLVHFRKYLKERLARGETLTVVIDEAQSLDEEVMETLFRLATPDPPSLNSLQILLVGHPDLEKKLNAEKLCSFKDRTTMAGRIKPLNREECREYINNRLKLVGREISEIFAPEVISKVWDFARGNPRVINLLCDRALLVGHSCSCHKVDSKIINEAINDLNYLRVGKFKPSKPGFSREKSGYKILRILFFVLSVGVFLCSIGWFLFAMLRK